MIINKTEQNLQVCIFLFLFTVIALPGAAYATEFDALDFFIYWPFIIIIGLIFNCFLKLLLTGLSGKLELSRIITLEIVILFSAYAISEILSKGQLLTIIIYYPWAYLLNMFEINNREKLGNINFILLPRTKRIFSALSSATLLVSVITMKLMHLAFK